MATTVTVNIQCLAKGQNTQLAHVSRATVVSQTRTNEMNTLYDVHTGKYYSYLTKPAKNVFGLVLMFSICHRKQV